MEDYQAITVRLPRDLYECLRREAFDERISQADIIRAELADRYGRTVDERRRSARRRCEVREFWTLLRWMWGDPASEAATRKRGR